MQVPRQLDDYFLMVHDFLYKSFRDDCKLFLALKSSHDTTLSLRPATAKGTTSTTTTPSDAPSGNPSTSTVSLSPRLHIREDGTTFGKLKMGLRMQVPEVCQFNQKLVVGTDGKACGSVELDELVDGLTVRGNVVVNTIAPATEDDSALHAQYFKKDFYCSTAVSRNGYGSAASGAHFGAKFQDLILGIGITRKYFSASEADQRELALLASPDEDSQLYVGGGIHGKNWAFGGRVVRSNDLWSTAELAMFRKIEASTAVACAYGFDLGVSKAHLSLGASQAFNLRFPALLAPRESSSNSSSFWTDAIPLVGALKGDSFGNVLATMRGTLNQSLQWGVVFKKNLCDPASRWGVGFQLTLEDQR